MPLLPSLMWQPLPYAVNKPLFQPTITGITTLLSSGTLVSPTILLQTPGVTLPNFCCLDLLLYLSRCGFTTFSFIAKATPGPLGLSPLLSSRSLQSLIGNKSSFCSSTTCPVESANGSYRPGSKSMTHSGTPLLLRCPQLRPTLARKAVNSLPQGDG